MSRRDVEAFPQRSGATEKVAKGGPGISHAQAAALLRAEGYTT